MTQRLDPDADLGAELLRLAEEQCRAVAAELRKSAASPPEPAQDRSRVRAKIKKLRAILALSRDGIGREALRREEAWLRRQSLLLAPARDAEALTESLRRLRRRAGPSSAPIWDRVLTAAAAAPGAAPAPAPDAGLLARAFELRAARMARLFEGRIRKRHVRRRLEQSRKRAQRALAEALEQPSGENFHRLRRRLKRAGLQLELLGKAAPKGSPPAKKLTRLALDLGEAHDLELLLAWLPSGVQAAALSGEEEAAVRSPLMRRLETLRTRSLGAAKRALGPARPQRG